MESADPRHPRRQAIDQLTISIAQAEEGRGAVPQRVV